jgi:hypothetical protein
MVDKLYFCWGEECNALIPFIPSEKKHRIYCRVCARIIDKQKKRQREQDRRDAKHLLRSWYTDDSR